jgi:hypothetical protein
VVLLASVVAQLEATLRAAAARTGVPGRTLRRWGGWWRESFSASRTWAEVRSLFVPPAPEEADLPRSLVTRSTSDLRAGGSSAPALADVCAFVARLIAPVTTASVTDGARFVRDVAQHLSAIGGTQKMAF